MWLALWTLAIYYHLLSSSVLVKSQFFKSHIVEPLEWLFVVSLSSNRPSPVRRHVKKPLSFRSHAYDVLKRTGMFQLILWFAWYLVWICLDCYGWDWLNMFVFRRPCYIQNLWVHPAVSRVHSYSDIKIRLFK